MTEQIPPREPEHTGPIWKHPYMLYVILTGAIFAFLSIMGWIFYSNDLIPDRGIHSPSGQSP